MNTEVSDISTLKNMPLKRLSCDRTLVTNLAPLKTLPLIEFCLNLDPQRDSEIVRSIKTLGEINDLPVAEFWKQVAAGKIPPPNTRL